MRTKYLLATLAVGVVAAASLGTAVALTAGVDGGEVVASTTTGAGGGTDGRTSGDPAGTTGGRTAGTTGGHTGDKGTGRTGGPGPEKLSQPDLVAKVKPSVVHLAGSSGSGSGVVVDDDRGLVLTNAHVTAGQQGLRARVGDDPTSETAARLVAAAPCDDLAVVELVNKPADLRAIRLGDSSRVRPGDHVTVLGYPVSFAEQTGDSVLDQQVVANDGSVSAVNVVAAPDPGLPRYVSTIQHQAPVNHGNSGGPLVDDQGRLVGVNSLGNDDAQGQFYSISVNRVRQLLPDLVAGTSQANLGWELYPRRQVDLPAIFAEDPDFAGQGGAAFGQQVNDRLDQEGVDGLYVWDAEPGSAAEAGNLGYGDLVTSIDGQPVRKVQDVCDLVLAKRPGETVRVAGRYLNSTADPAQVLTSWETEVAVG
jgi:S1-C subfamily serine protease